MVILSFQEIGLYKSNWSTSDHHSPQSLVSSMFLASWFCNVHLDGGDLSRRHDVIKLHIFQSNRYTTDCILARLINNKRLVLTV